MRNIRSLSKDLNNLKEFADQANEAFGDVAKSINNIELAIRELYERLEELESKQQPKSKKEV
jgi:uncharacterized coiled-coil DUF342 family protein